LRADGVRSYKQALSVVEKAKKMCQKSDIPFTRPTDYYAEMIKVRSTALSQ
jgi:chromosome condensin MukBEF ATPase and DNA-binding subunit MukB